MPRPTKQLPVDLDLDENELDLRELAEERHALNVLVPEFDWLRAQELAEIRGDDSVSDVIRRALSRELNDAREAEHLRIEATNRLKFERDRRQRKANFSAERASLAGSPVEQSAQRITKRS